MSPKPQNLPTDVEAENGDRVVISGMAGLYPDSHNVKEFQDLLYNKVNPVTAENARWKYNHPEVSHHTGKVPELQYFDAQFFKVHYRLGNSMDSMGRKILEQAFDAIYDAGISPEYLSGTKVGVYVGTCFSETEKACFYVATSRTGFGIAGCSKTMFANRISYWLNAKGPSMSVDQACCSSTVALELAYQAIMRGEIDSAIVGGASLCLHPQSSVHYGRIMPISKDGTTRSFDKDARGCARSEAINVLFLQKAKDALRVYAEVVHVKTEFNGLLEGESGPRYGFYREPNAIADFLKTFYKEARVSPKEVEYVEAVGSATPEADKAELEALDDVFCGNRSEPLYVGSVMSNIGYGEAASGVSAITKVLLGFEKGKLAANLHLKNPRDDIKAIRDGKIQIITDHQPLRNCYAAVNSLSVTGVNAHLLLKGHNKQKDLTRYACNIPRLVVISGRQQSAVEKILSDLKSRPIDAEEIALLHNIHQTRISGHLGRGYVILDTNEANETVSVGEKANFFDDASRPLWFVYSGMGSQWAGMGAQLMRIPVFAAAIERCRKALEPKGIDIVHIITSPDKTIFDNILHSFVGIAAIQIGLTDVLKELGIVPDKIIGHSVGELGCAYADGCLTADEMILSAYCRGLVSVQTPFIRGSMAAVGVGYQQIQKLCPPEIEVACHNSSESSTISGPADVMRQFVASLAAKGIFVKEVPCSNIAYHSRYIAEAGPGLLKYLSEVIKTPRMRSERWLSTSIAEDRWHEPLAQYSSAEYHTNNLLCPVLFEETSRHIPKQAVLVEVAPHGLLQAILKRAHPSASHVPLAARAHADNALFLLQAIGNLYMEGYMPKVKALYPKVEFPVSVGTPMLGHLVEWAHTEKWNLPLYVSAHRKMAAASKFVISLHDDEHRYLQGHVIKEKNLYPFSAVLVSVWDTLAMSLKLDRKSISVQFQNVQFFAQPMLHERRQITLSVSLHRGTGKFEVRNEKMTVATGTIQELAKDDKHRLFKSPLKEPEALTLKIDDIYKLLLSRNYNYSGEFRSIQGASASLTEATVSWNNNWVTLIDSLLQINMLRRTSATISQPDSIRKLTININEHKKVQSNELIANITDLFDSTRCGGVVIENLRFHDLLVGKEETLALESLKFVPHFTSNELDEPVVLHVFSQIIAENVNKEEINAIKLQVDATSGKFDWLENIMKQMPGGKYNFIKDTNAEIDLENADVIFLHDLSSNERICKKLYKILPNNIFIINKEYCIENKIRPSSLYSVICSHVVGDNIIQLIKWHPEKINSGMSAFTVRSESDLSYLISTLNAIPSDQRILIFSTYPMTALEYCVKKWRQSGRIVNLIFVNHELAPEQFEEELPSPQLAISILDHGIWGGNYYMPIKEASAIRQNVMLHETKVGDIKSLKWIEAPQITDSGISVKVHYAGINVVDANRASGITPINESLDHGSFGMDFSGVTDRGTKVMGLIQQGALRSKILANPNLIWPVPEHWSLEDAATVPLAYCIAFYCLSNKSRFYPGISVLVHGGTGALGQAAISICLAYNCTVFTTVSDCSKKHFLKKLFPQIKDEHIGNSRDLTFGDLVMTTTKGKGCDIVLGDLKSELKNVSLNCCGSSGLVIDTGLIQNREDYTFGMHYLTKDRSYKMVNFSSVFEQGKEHELKQLQSQLAEGIARGYVRPLTRVTLPPQEISRAFALVAASKHRGRVLIDMQRDVAVEEPRLIFNPKNYNIVISDCDVVTLQLVDRLITRGAKKVHIVCHDHSESLMHKIRSWRACGVHIKLINQEIWNKSNIASVLDGISDKIEGIFTIITNDSKFEEISDVMKDVDAKTRQLCPLLRYFAIASENLIGEDVAIARRKNHKPATLIKLPALNKSPDNYKEVNMPIRNAIEAIEAAVISEETVVSARYTPKRNISLIADIAKWAGIEIPSNVDENATLSSLGMDETHARSVQARLRDQHNLYYRDQDITNFTIQRIREIEEQIIVPEFKDADGLDSFYSYVDSDELFATTEMTFLTTLTNSASKRDDEFDSNQKFLCVVPGVEGSGGRFARMCARLKLPALVLQPGLDANETLQDIAKRFAKTLLKRTELKDNFYLLGYETGIIIALEIAAILEDHGLTGVVYCIGGSPQEIQAQFTTKLKEYGDDELLQKAVGRHMVKLMSGNLTDTLEKAFDNAPTWNDKVNACVRDLRGRVNHSAQYAKKFIETAYARIVQVKEYSLKPRKLRSRIIQLKPKGLAGESIEYKLQAYCIQPVVEYALEAPLVSATEDLRCAGIINKHLDEEILQAFEQKNLCETYLLNADTFMTAAEL